MISSKHIELDENTFSLLTKRTCFDSLFLKHGSIFIFGHSKHFFGPFLCVTIVWGWSNQMLLLISCVFLSFRKSPLPLHCSSEETPGISQNPVKTCSWHPKAVQHQMLTHTFSAALTKINRVVLNTTQHTNIGGHLGKTWLSTILTTSSGQYESRPPLSCSFVLAT